MCGFMGGGLFSFEINALQSYAGGDGAEAKIANPPFAI